MTEAGVDAVRLFEDTVALEKKFRSLLEAHTHPGTADISSLLQTFYHLLLPLTFSIRSQTEAVLFADIEFARTKTIEERLWTHIHYRIIDDFKKRVANVKPPFAMGIVFDWEHEKSYGTSRPVEFRKLIDAYTRFLKDTTTFYRVLIQKLVSHFNVVELQPIVAQFNLPIDTRPEAPKFPSKKVKGFVYKEVQSCLIKLGDISRYRALTPKRTKTAAGKPDYGPAYGYYVLAQSLLPENGAPANQLAVLSTYGKDHLSSTYYFYRAVACDEPFGTARNNLDVGFKKVLRDGVGLDGVEREDVGNLIEAFLRMHAEFYRLNETGSTGMSFDDSNVVPLLETVIRDRLVEAKFLNRLTFINLAALYVAEHRHQRNAPLFLNAILAQYTLLLKLLSTDLKSVDTSDVQAHITPIIRRTTPSLRLYSKWLVLHHSQIPTAFWHEYVAVANLLSCLWPSPVSPPKLTTPLEEDLAAAGFAPLEAQPEDPSKRKQKRDRARIGNRKKGFDKLLLQWGRRGGDSHVASRYHQRESDHPNVETTLRLADLFSDALELASIPVCPVDFSGRRFWVRGKEEIMTRMDDQQVVSTGLAVEVLGRMSLDEPTGGDDSSEDDDEDDDGMDFSPGKMVDDIVGSEKMSSSSAEDEEEIIFRGKATRKQLLASCSPPQLTSGNSSRPTPLVAPPLASPIHVPQQHHLSTLPSPITAIPAPPEQPRTVMDLMLQAFPKKTFSGSPSTSPMNLSPHLQTIPPHVDEAGVRGNSRAVLGPFEDGSKRAGSPVGVIGQGRASPRRTSEKENTRWSGGFPGL